MRSNNSLFPAMIVGFLGLIASAFALATTHEHAMVVQSGDPLFSLMVGHWTGQGTRTYPLSGRITQVTTEVTATISDVNGEQRLTSTNQITETPSTGAANSYQTVYWIEPLLGHPGSYTLGYNLTTPGSPTVTSTGILGGDMIFRSDQNLGNAYVIHSETQFSGNKSTFTETTFNGSSVVLKTVIDYERTGS
jgi:hypothetical protein